MGKLIKRIPGLRLLISSLPGSALRTHVESLGKPRDVNKHSQSLASDSTSILKALPGKLETKDANLVFLYIMLNYYSNFRSADGTRFGRSIIVQLRAHNLIPKVRRLRQHIFC